MKKLSILLVVFLVSLTSCSEDSSPVEINGDIVGTWKMVDYDYSGKTTTTFQGQTIIADFVGEAFDMEYKLIFGESPNNLTSQGSFKLKLTTTIQGQTSVENAQINDFLTTGSWEIVEGELITDTEAGGRGTMKIVKLTGTELVLSVIQEEDLSQAGATIVSQISAIISLERE